MSRVYEALRQSELDNGVSHTLFDPDTFLASSTSAAPAGRTAHHGNAVGSNQIASSGCSRREPGRDPDREQ